MNKKAIKIISSSFIFINLLSTFPKTALADSSKYYSSDDSIETSIENIDNKKEKFDSNWTKSEMIESLILSKSLILVIC